MSRFRQIVTKAGSKMAFVAIEDKTGEIEAVLFPKIFESLPVDFDVGAVVQLTGRLSGRDRDGNRTPDPSVMVETVEIISDDKLEKYVSTGIVKDIASQPKATPRKSRRDSGHRTVSAQVAVPKASVSASYAPITETAVQAIYIHVKDPSNGDKLLRLKEKLRNFEGANSVILVLGADKKDAVRMPFTTGICDELVTAIADIYGSECVAIK